MEDINDNPDQMDKVVETYRANVKFLKDFDGDQRKFGEGFLTAFAKYPDDFADVESKISRLRQQYIHGFENHIESDFAFANKDVDLIIGLLAIERMVLSAATGCPSTEFGWFMNAAGIAPNPASVPQFPMMPFMSLMGNSSAEKFKKWMDESICDSMENHGMNYTDATAYAFKVAIDKLNETSSFKNAMGSAPEDFMAKMQSGNPMAMMMGMNMNSPMMGGPNPFLYAARQTAEKMGSIIPGQEWPKT